MVWLTDFFKFFFQSVNFPFLVLLISGGHCLLALVENVDSFLLLGKSTDNAPGEVFDKVSWEFDKYNLVCYRPWSCSIYSLKFTAAQTFETSQYSRTK